VAPRAAAPRFADILPKRKPLDLLAALPSPAMRPVIGITTRRRIIETKIGSLAAETAELSYTQAVIRAGGVPVGLIPVPEEDANSVLERVDGLVLSGGGDLDPAWYEGSQVESLYEIIQERDRFEIALAREAARTAFPTLAICRGMQVVNVALGGTLIEDLPHTSSTGSVHSAPQAAYRGHKPVVLEPACRVAEVMGTDRPLVNSIHHQAVRDPGRGLRVVGRSDDGVIEALEAENQAWPLTAVQWHPEYLADGDSASQSLFEQLVADARAGPRPVAEPT
jgi:putative glutamine amidotransferase